jgi:hypothetical protein
LVGGGIWEIGGVWGVRFQVKRGERRGGRWGVLGWKGSTGRGLKDVGVWERFL